MAAIAKPARLLAAEIARHYHARPYATLVLEGGYEEAGDQGRYAVGAGDLLLHPAFSAHRDVVADRRTYVLDLPLPFDGRDWPGLASVRDPDLLIRVARRDVRDAQQLLLDGIEKYEPDRSDPADRLAEAVSQDASLAIGDWALANGHSREWLSRRFMGMYGVSSAQYRSEARSRQAWRRIVSSNERLADIAVDCGFADQAHMTRSVGQLTGRSPAAWRRAVTSVQEGAVQAL
jgi:AraC-like DNA-binding protein